LPGSVNIEWLGPFIRKPYHLDHAIAVIFGQLDQPAEHCRQFI
jgi:hypothetical protein